MDPSAAGPLPGGGFFVVGASLKSKGGWLLRVDERGQVKELEVADPFSRDLVAFTHAAGNESSADGDVIVVAKDGRASSTPLDGKAAFTYRVPSNWMLAFDGTEATVLRLRLEPAFAYRIDHIKTKPLEPAVPVPAIKGPPRR